MSSFSTTKPKKMNPLDKVIKKNPKYEHIQSTIDTGSSLTKYMKKIEEIKTNYRYQQDEIFKRMKITTFVQLLLQVAEVDTLEKEPFELESVRSEYNDDEPRNPTGLSMHTDRTSTSTSTLNNDLNSKSSRFSTLQAVIGGVGELDSNEKERVDRKYLSAEKTLRQLQQDLDMPYLLLDLRDKDEYDECHIITALNYPTAMLSRSVNNETPELLAYKNKSGKIIVVYDDDERIALRAATTLVQRGYDNLFLLSGGMKYSVKKFPEGLVTGVLPAFYAADKQKDVKTTRTIHSSTANGYSKASKKTFDRDDIEKLNYYMDESLLASDSTSRLSRATKTSRASVTTKASSLASVRTLSSIHEKPWKPI